MTFTERMSSMMSPDILHNVIKEQQPDGHLGALGRLKNDQNVWNPEGTTSYNQEERPKESKTLSEAYSDIKITKGTATEEMVCYSLKDKFSSIETQRKIDLEKSYTKSDIIATNAESDIQIGDISIKRGESIGIEVKCGEAAYLSSQISHIDRQLKGFDMYEKQNPSLEFHKIVMVTADYHSMSDSSKKHFNDIVNKHNANIHVLPFYAHDMTQTLMKIEEH